MPDMFAVAQHRALKGAWERLSPHDQLLAFLRDIHVVGRLQRVVDIHNILRAQLWHHARIQIHQGEPQAWDRGGVERTRIDVLEQASRLGDPDAVVWREDANVQTVVWSFLTLHGDTSTLRKIICSRRSLPTGISWRGFQQWAICRQHGCCCCSAPRPGPISFSWLQGHAGQHDDSLLQPSEFCLVTLG